MYRVYHEIDARVEKVDVDLGITPLAEQHINNESVICLSYHLHSVSVYRTANKASGKQGSAV